MPKVSVIMAAYNSADHIGESIESIINQTWTDWELIICDDCSTDDTYKIAKEYANLDDRIIVIRNSKNKKAAYTRNRCIGIAQGNFIAIQDADDISLETRLAKQVRFLLENKNIDFVGSASQSFDDEGSWRTTNPKALPGKRDFLSGSPFTHPSMMFTKEAIYLVSGYRVSKETIRGQDTDMIMRMYAKGLQGANIREVLHMYREDINAFRRRSMKFRIQASKRNLKRFKDLGLMPVGIIYAFKPVLGGLLPYNIFLNAKKMINKLKKKPT